MRRNSNLPRLVPYLAAASLAAWGTAGVAQVGGASTADELFGRDEPLALRLEASFGAVKRGDADPEYQPARLTYTTPDGATVATDLRVRLRGKSRREVCSFPPLLLNFRTKSVASSLFEGQNRLKLVTHCEDRDANSQYVFLEYLAYRVLNLVTDASLRVRAVEVTYLDTERGREIAAGPGILLEDEDAFAIRHALSVSAEERIDRARYDSAALGLLEVFQFFIGNTDWSAFAGPPGTPCCHNVVPLARADGVLLPIAYDFDAAGIVDANYALPNERLRIASVRQRLYRGSCPEPEALRTSLAPFQAKRGEIRALYEQHSQLSAKNRARALEYIDEFYRLLSNPKQVERAFRSNCAG
jgi:hypothetical protein